MGYVPTYRALRGKLLHGRLCSSLKDRKDLRGQEGGKTDAEAARELATRRATRPTFVLRRCFSCLLCSNRECEKVLEVKENGQQSERQNGTEQGVSFNVKKKKLSARYPGNLAASLESRSDDLVIT